LCCYSTEMILLPQDIADIEKLGYPREYFAVKRGSQYVLKNVNGHCVFLNPENNACTIYPYRPLGCRLYPLVYDVEKGVVTVDKLCPRYREVSSKVVKKYEYVFEAIMAIIGESRS